MGDVRKLREAVEIANEAAAKLEARKLYPDHAQNIGRAYNGSLDAAKALHEALLPGISQYSVTTDPTCLCVRVAWWPDGLSGQRTWVAEAWHEDNPARAWLLAILRALEGGGADG